MASFFESLVGSKPKVPEVKPVSLGEEQQRAISENLAAAPGAAKLAQLSQDQIRKMMEQAIPGFEGIVAKGSGNVADLLAGKIPSDVSEAVQRSSAGRSLSGGYGGSGMARNLVARDLGLTSLDLTQQGLRSAESWIGAMEQLYSPSEAIFTGMFVTPQQQFAASTEERNLQFQREWLANQIEAMPAPWATDLKQFVYRAMAAYSGTAVGNNPYSTPGSFGNPDFSGGVSNSYGRSPNGISWGASDWSAPSNQGFDFNSPAANPSSDAGMWG